MCSAAYFLGSNGLAAASATAAAGFASATFTSATFTSATFTSATFASATFASATFTSATFASAAFASAAFASAAFASATFASPAAATAGANVSKLIALVSGSNVPANSMASLFNVHGPLKPKITGSYTFTLSPATMVAMTCVFSPKSGPSSKTMLAMRPTSIVPTTLLKPSCLAGRVVKHESNSSSDKPLCMARRARAGKSPRFFNLTVPTLTSTPASSNCFTLRGANAHVSKSRNETDSSLRGSLTSGVFGKSKVDTIGKCVATTSFKRRNSVPEPITRAFKPNSLAKPAARKTSCSLLQSKITTDFP